MDWTLTTLIFTPLIGVLMILTLPREDHARIRLMALLTSLTTFGLAIVAAMQFNDAAMAAVGDGWADFHLLAKVDWIGGVTSTGLRLPVDISYHVAVDTISLWLVMLTAFLAPLAVLASYSGIRERVREYFVLLLILEVAMLGVFCARDLLLFFVFFEFTLIPLYFIIGIWGGPEKRRAANKFFIFTMAGSVLTFAGILYLTYFAYHHGYPYYSPDPKRWINPHNMATSPTFSTDLGWITHLGRTMQIPFQVQWWLFLAFAAGFAIKVPLFPVHTWLPLAHTEAPTAGSAILAGVLLKLGTYGFFRICIPVLPDASYYFAPSLAVLAVIGIIYGALCAWVQSDVKKLVAYSSVSHLGFCMLGMFSMKMAGATGSLMYMINHGLSTAALFFMVGMMYERYHTRDMNKLGGLARPMPWFAFFLIFFTVSSIGLPGLNGFVGEFLVLLGTAMSDRPRVSPDDLGPGPLGLGYAIPAALGIILGAVYMLWMCQRVLFGPRQEPPDTPDTRNSLAIDLTRRERAVLIPLAAACVILGVWPKPFIDTVQPAIAANVFHLYSGVAGEPLASNREPNSNGVAMTWVGSEPAAIVVADREQLAAGRTP